MNSTEDVSQYKQSYYSPTLSRRLQGYTYDIPEKIVKKEKKWTISSLFRRKKKENSESSSENEVEKKGFLSRNKKKKIDSKKKKKSQGTFDHIVLTRNDDSGILSDPTGGFTNYPGRYTLKSEFSNQNITTQGSNDSLLKKNRHKELKIRAEARRIVNHNNSSDDDNDSLSSSLKYYNDLLSTKDNAKRRSRTARTERYLRRHSKDFENSKLSKSDIENDGRSLSRSPLLLPSILINTKNTTNLLTIPPSSQRSVSCDNNINKTMYNHSQLSLNDCNSKNKITPPPPPPRDLTKKINLQNYERPFTYYFPNGHKKSKSFNYNYSQLNDNLNCRSTSDDHLIKQQSLKMNSKRPNSTTSDLFNYYQTNNNEAYNYLTEKKPRSRKPIFIKTNQNFINDINNRTDSQKALDFWKQIDNLEKNNLQKNPIIFTSQTSVQQQIFLNPHQNQQLNHNTYVNHNESQQPSQNLHPNHNFNENHQRNFCLSQNHLNGSQKHTKNYYLNHNENQEQSNIENPRVSENLHKSEHYQNHNENYYENQPQNPIQKRCLSMNQTHNPLNRHHSHKENYYENQHINHYLNRHQSQKENNMRRQQLNSSPKLSHNVSQKLYKNCNQNHLLKENQKHDNYPNQNHVQEDKNRTKSQNIDLKSLNSSFKPISCTKEEENDELKRKSSNLEAALNELEAIYNSLRLGDEDLLERAEEREKQVLEDKLKEKRDYYCNNQNYGSRGTLSDSSFNYETFDQVDSPKRKKFTKKSHTIDRKYDDMAYRKLNKDKSQTVSDPKSVLSKVSYLLASPLYTDSDNSDRNINKKEPDITLDDVVYRNRKYKNNSLKVVEPQPPFGIPLGPITPSSNSDYLHAVPENIPKSTKIPDLVKDDLAFRNLRKDINLEESSLPPVTSSSIEDLKNNNLFKKEKKRAVRSLSANLCTIITNNDVENEFKTLTDIADAMEIARQVLKKKEQKICETKRAFLSDTDTNKYHLRSKNVKERHEKESTPIPMSELEKDDDQVDFGTTSFDNLLTALALEARETSERITKELKQFDDDVIDNANVENSSNVDDNANNNNVGDVLINNNENKESDHDYENIMSEPELNLNECEVIDEKPSSPFDEHKAEIISKFQELNDNKKTLSRKGSVYDNVNNNNVDDKDNNNCVRVSQRRHDEVHAKRISNSTGKHSKRTRSRLPRWLRPHSYTGNLSDSATATEVIMSEGQQEKDKRAERMARYKEERRKQLAAQFSSSNNESPKRVSSSSSSDNNSGNGPRTTRTSRLRAAAAAANAQDSTLAHVNKVDLIEKNCSSPCENSTDKFSHRLERDKSSKRKSNLNRSLNSEEIPTTDSNDIKTRRQRRRFFPQELFETSNANNGEKKSSTTTSSSQSPQNASTSRKSDLRVHMENARKGCQPPFSEMGKMTKKPNNNNAEIAKKMNELTKLTKDTLERVENLTSKQNKSILKKKSEDSFEIVSILKRKDTKTTTATPPVTFSPNTIETTTPLRRQGILKKRRSLDESQVLRANRSQSPLSSSILKNQRRSSLENIRHSILKNKSSNENSLNSPLNSSASTSGILKNRNSHISIKTAVFLAAAEGAEIILDTVKPILKKKPSDDNLLNNDNVEVRPILKKKSSEEDSLIDYDKPKPILKLHKTNTFDSNFYSCSDSDEFKSILKPKLSFSEDFSGEELRKNRRSFTICSSDYITRNDMIEKNDNGLLEKCRPLSVSQLVMSFEEETGKQGAIPKRMSLKRMSDRHRTQPVTSNELEASLNFVRNPHQFEEKSSNYSINSLCDFTTSLENDRNLNDFLSSSLLKNTTSPDLNSSINKMSSDSAFQSLGDGLELEQDEQKSPEKVKIDLQKAIAQEAALRIRKGMTGVQKYKNRRSVNAENARFSTQPVTLNEVQKASKNVNDLDDADPAKLSLLDKIRLFNTKTDEITVEKQCRKRCLIRFKTLPISLDEVDCARSISPTSYALDDKEKCQATERKGILKSTQPRSSIKSPTLIKNPPRTVFKKSNDTTYDEGISCNDSGSDTENPPQQKSDYKRKIDKIACSSDDGESSSGSREVKSIFKNENKLKVKQVLEGVLSKSKSQGTFGDEKHKTIQRSQTQAAMPRSIAELQAKLQQSGDTDWKKRIQQNNNSNDELKLLKDKNCYNDELTTTDKSILKLKKDELDQAAQKWKHRIEKSDVEKFSIAGRMDECNINDNLPQIKSDNKKTPKAKRFKGKTVDLNASDTASSTPASPVKFGNLTRSFSVPETDQDSGSESQKNVGRTVTVTKPDDFTFKNFYKSINDQEKRVCNEKLNVSLDDFDLIERQSLLVQKKNIQIHKRRFGKTKNPIKALQLRTDLNNEYTEVLTGVAEREKKRLNIEKLAKSSNLAVEALAGLASKEDFTAISLKKPTYPLTMVPYRDVMLLQIKGRRHVQTRLVEPTIDSLNEGDNFLLIASNNLYNYIGEYSNIIEQSKTLDIINFIQKTGDLGCKFDKIVTITHKNYKGKENENFWKILGGNWENISKAGHPNEDEIYESQILQTNMIYELIKNELVPIDEYWGKQPKYEMLQKNWKIYCFDFGTEMYIWSGKNADIEQKKLGFKLAKELWEEGYNYQECSLCPINIAQILGKRSTKEVVKTNKERPSWALFTKLTQYRETILFKEKFQDWPDYTRLIKMKGDETQDLPDVNFDLNPCVIEDCFTKVDLVVENYHLGRGDSYFDPETNRQFEFQTLDKQMWKINDNKLEHVEFTPLFQNSYSYIIKWNFRTVVFGRDLNGKPSKYLQKTGRDRVIYFCWQGCNSSVNEKGCAALLTIELDSEKAAQLFVEQYFEPPIFLRLFNGLFTVLTGKKLDQKPKLFWIKGELKEEMAMIQVPLRWQQLRSKSSFLLVEQSGITLWFGSKIMEMRRKLSRLVAEKFGDFMKISGDLLVVNEGVEGDNFIRKMKDKRDFYFSLKDSKWNYNFTMKMFQLSSLSGQFQAVECLCPYRSEFSSPYPFQQSELYSVSQPAIFLIDNHHELWLWQGWWPETDVLCELNEQTGSGCVRWQAERKAAMQTAVNYWQKKNSDNNCNSGNGDRNDILPIYLVWAGLEPLEFQNLFPIWTEREDIAELNLKDGREKGAKLLAENELKLLTRTIYPLNELLQRPLPDGVNPSHLEIYLSHEDFQNLLQMTKDEFQKLPLWKQTAIKKDKGLF